MARTGHSKLSALGRRAALVAGLACAAACNDPLQTGTTTTTPTNGSPAGIWTGVDSATGMQMIGMINSGGLADFFLSNGEQFVGTAQVAGTALAISLDGYTQVGAEFSDGSTFGVGTFNGTLASGSTISGTLTFTTSDNTAVTSTWSLTFSSLYDTAPTLDSIAATYADSTTAVSAGNDPLGGASVTISSNGTLFAQGSPNGCVLNGSLSTSDTSANLFEVAYSYASCTGTYAILNGLKFSGLAYVNSSDSPAQIVIAVTAQSSSDGDYGVVTDLTAS
jgi:hypothetical protein